MPSSKTGSAAATRHPARASPLACASLGRALLVWCLDGASRTFAGDVQARAGAGRWPGAAVAGGRRCPRRDSRSPRAPATATAGQHHNAASRRWGGHPSLSWRRRQHPLDRPAPAAPAEQGLDPDPRPLRPPDEGERLPVPREQVNAAVRHRGRRSVVAGRPGMRQVPGPGEPSPLRVSAQGQVGLSFQPAPELLVGVGSLVGREVPPGAALVGHVGTSSDSVAGRCRAACKAGRCVHAQDAVRVGLRQPGRPHRGGEPTDQEAGVLLHDLHDLACTHSSRDDGSAAGRQARPG
jgi:hypothetical protein